MKNWLLTTDVKKIQRRINRTVRGLNKNIENDELWKGRFYARQVKRAIAISEDKSWLYVRILIRFTDKATGKTHEEWFEKSDFFRGFKLFEVMNDFIIFDCRVWDEHPSRETAIDYRRKKK